MDNSKEILQAESCNEEVKQKGKTGNGLMKSFLVLMLLISVAMMSSCWWGMEGRRGREGRGNEPHHEEHHEEHHEGRH